VSPKVRETVFKFKSRPLIVSYHFTKHPKLLILYGESLYLDNYVVNVELTKKISLSQIQLVLFIFWVISLR